jgi:hypothetical protein
VKTQSKVLNSLPRTPVFLQNSPKKRPFFLSILGRNSAVTALAVAAEEFAPVFAPRVFRWKNRGFALSRLWQNWNREEFLPLMIGMTRDVMPNRTTQLTIDGDPLKGSVVRGHWNY